MSTADYGPRGAMDIRPDSCYGAPMNQDFLPTTAAEMAARGWTELDILFVSGDAYVDHPAFGVPLLARLLEDEGFRVGILAQPDWKNPDAFHDMGRPRLFAAVSSGAMDSMVNHYTAAKKIRRDDAYTPGGVAGARPNRAVIAYTAALKGAFKGLPVVIGGIEASLRRLAHYDYWDDKVRRSVLVDSKADLLLYGMAETALLQLAWRLHNGEAFEQIDDLRGSARLTREVKAGATLLPSYEKVAASRDDYNQAFKLAANQANPASGKVLAQAHDNRWVIVNPPAAPLTPEALDRVYALPFTRRPHPSYNATIPAYEQIKFSITSHRGCFGGCAFCAITHHQGKTIQSCSIASIRDEVERLAHHPEFKGTISDVGGPTANMYGLCCGNPEAEAQCQRSSCLYPKRCKNLVNSDRQAVQMLQAIAEHPAVKHLYIASGIRYDLLEEQPGYFDRLLEQHVGGLLKVAPETTSDAVARIMRKPGAAAFESFLSSFYEHNRRTGKRQGVVPYFISGHPGCTLDNMIDVALFLKGHHLRVEQVQEFTPTPGSLSTCIYHTGRDPFTGETVHVPRAEKERRLHKALLLYHLPENRRDIEEALKICGREQVKGELLGSGTRRGGDRRKPLRKNRNPKIR